MASSTAAVSLCIQVQQSGLDSLCSLKTNCEYIKDGVYSRRCCVELDQIMTTHAAETLLRATSGVWGIAAYITATN